MPASIIGRILADGTPPAAAVHYLTATEFSGGYIAHDASLDASADGDLVCVALGRARFPADDGLAGLAESGQAARWLQRYRQHGADAAQAVRGRFAVAVVDAAKRSTWLVTDRFGTYPLCYSATRDGFEFADRADALPGPQRALSSQAIFNYLFFHAIPAPLSIFEGVYRLPAGHCVSWARGELETHAWWTPRFAEAQAPSFNACRQTFLGLVQEGVEHEADTDKVGAFLSGGTDSSTVSGMLCKVLGAPAKTYSIGFDATGYDEMEYARIAARHFGTEHHEYYVTPGDLLDGIPRAATHYDQPFGNSSAVPAWICAIRAREDGVAKMLAGDGGDELFGGNVRYAKQRVFGLYDAVPAALRSVVLEPVLGLRGMDCLPIVKKGVSYVQQARVPMPDRLQMYNLLFRLGPENVFTPGFLAGIDQSAPLRTQRDTWYAVKDASLINRMLAFDWKYTLADNDLPKVIGATRLAGVDVGFPLLSDELLEFSLGLPPAWKLKRLTLRWFFKEALRGFLPDAIISKKKHGFGLPFGVWACQHDALRKLAIESLNSLKTRGIVRPAFIDDLLTRLLPAHPGYYGEMVWILMILEMWMREHAPDWQNRG